LCSVSCSGADFCLALSDSGGDEVYDGKQWTPAPPAGAPGSPTVEFVGLSCSSSSFCVVVLKGGTAGYCLGNGWVIGRNPQWGGTTPQFQPVAVSCSSTTLCAAVNSERIITVLTSPGWNEPAVVDRAAAALAVSCVDVTTCLAIARNGATYRYELGSVT
jgi:hypothetical protein